MKRMSREFSKTEKVFSATVTSPRDFLSLFSEKPALVPLPAQVIIAVIFML